MKKIYQLLSFSLLGLIIFGIVCTKQAPVEDGYVMQIDRAGLRKGVFLRRYQMTKFYNSEHEYNTKKLIKFIRTQLEPNYLFIEHAYELGKDQNPTFLQKMNEYRVNLIADNHPVKTKRFTISKDELRTFHQKLEYTYDVEIIQTNSYADIQQLRKALMAGKKVRQPKKDSGFTFPIVQELTHLLYGERLHPELFPVLEKMKPATISKPVYVAPLWTIIKLKKKSRNTKFKPFEEMEKETLNRAHGIFKYYQQKRLVEQLREQIPVTINETLFPELVNAYSKEDQRGWIDRRKLKAELLNQPFLIIGSDSISVTRAISNFNQASQFYEFKKLTKTDLAQFADDYVAQYLLYLDALKKGVEQNELIQDRLINKEHRQLLTMYLNEEIAKKVTVTDEETLDYYKQHSDRWNDDFEAVKTLVRNDVKNKKMEDYRDSVIKKLRKKYRVRYNKPLLASIARELTKKKAAQANKQT